MIRRALHVDADWPDDTAKMEGDCPTCGGTGQIEMENTDGSVEVMLCPDCDGTGWAEL